MTTNHTNQQNILSSQSNELVSRQEPIQGLEELNEAEIDSITGGIIKCINGKEVDIGGYHFVTMDRPT